MHCMIALILKLAFLALPAAEQPKVPQAWNANTIEWQKVDPDGQKWAVLEGHSDAPDQAFTYAAFIPAGRHEHQALPQYSLFISIRFTRL